jgi:hypothetical protein
MGDDIGRNVASIVRGSARIILVASVAGCEERRSANS